MRFARLWPTANAIAGLISPNRKSAMAIANARYFTAVGLMDIPTEEEILKIMDEIQKHPLDFRVVA